MKLTVDAGELRSAVEWAAKISPARPPAPILGALRIDAGEALTISATDYDAWADVTVSAAVHTPGRVAVSARLLAEVCKAMRSDSVDLVLEDRLSLRAGALHAQLPLMAVEEFPPRPESPEAGHLLPEGTGAFLAAAAKIGADLETRMPDTCGTVLTASRDRLTIAASDRYRLVSMDFPWNGPADPVTISLFGSTAHALADVLKNIAGQARLGLPVDSQPGVLGVAVGGRRLTVRTGTKGINVPAALGTAVEHEWFLTVAAAELVGLLRRVAGLAEMDRASKSRQVRLSVGDGQIQATAVGDGELCDSITADCEPNTAWEVTVNPDYLADVLAVHSGVVQVAVADPPHRRPILLTPHDSDPPVTSLVMAIRK